jgi:predicted Fe-Mo cluster-binding NifX family protein
MKMRVAIAVWGDEVATTFDFAGELVVVEVADGCELGRDLLKLDGVEPDAKERYVVDLGVQALLCGAISRGLMRWFRSDGVQVVPFVSGEMDEVLAAYLCGRLEDPRFLQAGCRPGVRMRWRHGAGRCSRKGGRRCQNAR